MNSLNGHFTPYFHYNDPPLSILFVTSIIIVFLNIDHCMCLAGSVVQDRDPPNIWNPRKKWSFLDTIAYVVECSKPWQLNPTLWLSLLLIDWNACLSTDFNHVTLNDFESSFCVKFCFAQVSLCLELWRLGYSLSECCWRTWTAKNSCGIARFPCGSM